MHDYKHKYGTLSGGSALSKSMKYAETWLYGSMAARPSTTRPSLFMYPEMSPPAGYALVMCACADFLSGTTRGKKSAAVCKKCGGSRKTSWDASPTQVRGFGTVRLSQPKSRPELPRLDDLKDPYDMMRKSRLATVSSLRPPPDGRSRAKSSSPRGRRRRSKSPPRHRSPDSRFLTNGVCNESARKSILECDVNPYELISQYLKNDPIDPRLSVEEDEFSDNLSDNALDDYAYTRRTKREDKRTTKKAATVGSTNKKGFLDALRSKWDDQVRVVDPVPGGVSIGGQRIKLFNNNEPIPIVTNSNEFVSDSDDTEEEIYDVEKHKAWFSDRSDSKPTGSQTPKTTNSPKRPPRKLKTSLEPVNKIDTPKTTNETGKNRVNFALDVPNQTSRRSNSLTSSASLEIKSILKKPNSTLNLADTLKSASPNKLVTSTPRRDSSSESGTRSVTPNVGKNFRLPSFKDYKQQQQNRKKKQVQFRVSEEGESADSGESSAVDGENNVSNGVESNPDIVITDPESSEVLRLKFFGDNQEDTEAVNKALPDPRNNLLDSTANSAEDHDGAKNSSLQRSLSDRTSPGAEPGCKFNDTMRLRLRTGRRDTRDTFTEGRKSERRVLSPGRPRPKEPPPPPPPPAETEDNSSVPPPPPPPPRQIFPFTKEEIEKINQKRPKSEIRPRSSSNSPVRQSETSPSGVLPRRTSLTFPITLVGAREGEEGPLWHRDSSVVDNTVDTILMPLEEDVPTMETLSSVTEVYEALELNSKLREDSERIMFKGESVKLHVPPAEPATVEKDESQNCTIVTVSSTTQKLSVTSAKSLPNRRTSIMITGNQNDQNNLNVSKTSVRIGDSPSINPGSNKVTINVGGFDYQNSKNKTAKSNTQIEIKNDFKSNITIGPSENKSRTLLILDSSSNNAITKETVTKSKEDNVKDIVIDIVAQEEINNLIRNKIDPVEAARKNIVPHFCGKAQEDVRGKDTPENKAEDVLEKDNECCNTLNTQSSIESETLDDDVFATKDDNSDDNSDCYVCAKKLKAKQKQDDEEIRVGLEFDSDENHYEIIRDPIYEEISDTPPPLPLSPPPASVDIDDSIPTRSIFEGASKYDILNYLETAKERGIVIESEDDSEVRSPEHSRISSLDLSSRISQLSNASDSSEDSCNLIISPPDTASITSDKVRKSSVEIERNDSGVGSETSKCSRSRWQHVPATHHHGCEDCDQPVETQVTDSGLMFAPLVCRKCAKRRAERREIITEIVETEEKYGRDLRIILDEFYRPMLVAGLLTPDQLSAIFLNVEELLENNASLAEKLRDALEIALDQGDEDFLTVNIGSIFLDAAPMLHAFESYCTRQGAASLLLANLEKEKELLRIFLRVSQMENSVLRRMNLNSFLMVPVQRVTKYPLLLARLYRVTPTHLKSREALRLAQNKIELHLEHINSLAKDISTTRLWRRISIINGRRSSSETDMVNIKLRKVAVDVLEWNHDEVRFAMEGKLLFTQPTDNNWRRGRTIKLSPINAMLVTLGKPTEDYQPDSDELLAFPRKNGIRDATLLLLKEKSGRYGLLREPLFLDRCIICCEADVEDYFEVQELATKDTYLFKAEDGDQTKRWFRQLQYHAQGLGAWRKRRNALANIMINGMQLRT
ncbi:uncharacterized protein LOC129002329 [Macrosteles quadrilineatus]|uniref:uncharacterized protein LOC129002329 n=1 Tax=Macrosteles quadrilineatus TaxID=74068 RepID=UPI0023E2EEC2|nr:uncharacterized protein LOC129002329 [Macrosteles quadrilineatus]